MHKKTARLLNDLIVIHYYRIEGYEKALSKLKDNRDGDLRFLFEKMIYNSRECNQQLAKEVAALGEKPVAGTSGAGKISQAWANLKTLFTTFDRASILKTCCAVEEATQTEYNNILEQNLSDEILAIINDQKTQLLQAYNNMTALRNAQPG